eukprot:gene5767-11046_t
MRPLLEVVNKQCLGNYSPNRENAVEKAMIKFRGTLSFRQYMPAKPTKYGIRVWERADSKNGCVAFHENLLKNGIYGCGTVKSNAKSVPNEMCVTRGKKSGLMLQPGDSKTWQKNGITATVWQEKKGRKPVRLLSSNHNPNFAETSVKRKQKDGSYQEISCPPPVRSYNKNMAAVDRADQMRTAYCCARKSRRWWTYILWFLVDLSISNAFILMKESPNNKRFARTRKRRP